MNTEQTPPEAPQPGERARVTIDTLATGGDGIARHQGFTLFVPRSAPGDVLDVEITEVTRSFGRARIVDVVEPGPDRVPTSCPLAEGCPGCEFQHLRYEAQLLAKQTFVRDGLERIGRLKGVVVQPTLGMDHPWEYRNKGEFTAATVGDRLRLGYHGEGGEFLRLTACALHHPLSVRLLHEVEIVANALHLPLAQLITRVSPSENAALAILVCWEDSDRLQEAATLLRERIPELAGVLFSRVRGRSVVRRSLAEVIAGQGKLTQRLGEWAYTVSAESFFQVNNAQATQLVSLALEMAGDMGSSIFADGYCGVGTFLIPLAKRASRSIGVEEHPVALRDARDNLTSYAIHDVQLYEGRVESIFPRLQRKGRSLDVVLLDPPRKGAGRSVLESVAALGAQRIILVSCDPATLGRDAGDLAILGYQPEIVQPVDMFPQTAHVETIALLTKR
ncbi:MAG: 23S rRNA (uracil(1939)-C(5))-methyltransferase RlmD [Armatimonadota bacterium]